MYGDFQGVNQVMECINSSLLSIFLIDENQRITTKDIGSIDEIKHWANELCSRVIINDETTLRSLPIYSEICKSTVLADLPVGTMLEGIRTVTTGKRKWMLVEFNGQMGWVNRNCTAKTPSPLVTAIIILGIASVIFALVMTLVYFVKKRRKGKTHNA